MQLVRQKEENGRALTKAPLVLAGLLVAALAGGCATGNVHGGGRGSKAAAGPQAYDSDAARALAGYSGHLKEEQAARVSAARRWRLAKVPLTPPA
ncbi:polysaccharide deacetylase family protein, partial [Streptomyces sp. YS-3]